MEKDSFISAYCAHKDAVITNRAQMLIVWESLRKFMLEWVVTRQRDLNLGFATLLALPVRRNWLEVLNHRYNRLAKRNKKFVYEMLTAQDRQSGTIRWDIVAIANEKFHNATLQMESFTKDKARYAVHVSDLMQSKSDRIHEIFKAYMAETGYPNHPIPRRWAKGEPKHVDVADVESPVESPDGDGGVLETSGQTDVATADASVFDLSNLPALNEGLRRDGDVDQFQNGDGGTVRMRLLSSSEKQALGELLVGRKDGVLGGVADSTQQFSNQNA